MAGVVFWGLLVSNSGFGQRLKQMLFGQVADLGRPEARPQLARFSPGVADIPPRTGAAGDIDHNGEIGQAGPFLEFCP